MRGSVYHGDTGVSARIQKKWLEVMSDTDLRGKLLWIVATNMPQLLDQAFLREGRFDDVLPFFALNASERAKVGPAILHKLSVQAEHAGIRFEHEILDDYWKEFGKKAHGHFKSGAGWSFCTPETHAIKEEDTEKGFVGGEIEYLIVRAYRRARLERRPLLAVDMDLELVNFMPKRDIELFEQATDMALLHCNSLEFVPSDLHDRARKLRGIQRSGAIDLRTRGPYL